MNSSNQQLAGETMPFSWAYRQMPYPSYWGEINSKSNFCEQDFIITQYICEFINTLSNVVYCVYAFYGIRANQNRSDATLRNFPYLGIAGVGIGSAMFHATMKNYTQWCDDCSMLIASGAVLHRVYSYDKTSSQTILYGLGIMSTCVAFITWHCIHDDTTMHSVFFGILVTIIGVKTRSVIAERVTDPRVRREVSKLTTWGSVIFIFGFILWIIDNAYCGVLTTWKRSIGMPWSFLLEFHGWWHFFTGIGAYIFIALVEYLTSEEAGQPLGTRFAWPVGHLINGNAGKAKRFEKTGPMANGGVKTKKNL